MTGDRRPATGKRKTSDRRPAEKNRGQRSARRLFSRRRSPVSRRPSFTRRFEPPIFDRNVVLDLGDSTAPYPSRHRPADSQRKLDSVDHLIILEISLQRKRTEHGLRLPVPANQQPALGVEIESLRIAGTGACFDHIGFLLCNSRFAGSVHARVKLFQRILFVEVPFTREFRKLLARDFALFIFVTCPRSLTVEADTQSYVWIAGDDQQFVGRLLINLLRDQYSIRSYA